MCLFGVALAGCGGDDDVDPGADAAIDAMVDGASSTLVGSWMMAPPTDPAIDVETMIFRADGTYDFSTSRGPETGRYSLSGTRLTLDSDAVGEGLSTIEAEFLLDSGGQHLLMPAFLPQGPVAGNVGTWRTATVADGLASSTEIVTAADHSATFLMTTAKGTEGLSGTWSESPTGFIFVVPDGPTFHFKPLEGAISYSLLNRVP